MPQQKRKIQESNAIKMNEKIAERIGGKYFLISTFMGIIIAQLILTFIVTFNEKTIDNFLWFKKLGWNIELLLGICLVLFLSFKFGKRAGKKIIYKSYFFAISIGIFYLFLSVILTTLTISCIFFFRYGIFEFNGFSNPIFDYFVKPIFWILSFGFIPIILLGIGVGIAIKRKLKN